MLSSLALISFGIFIGALIWNKPFRDKVSKQLKGSKKDDKKPS